jgi:hypothetical protein
MGTTSFELRLSKSTAPRCMVVDYFHAKWRGARVISGNSDVCT